MTIMYELAIRGDQGGKQIQGGDATVTAKTENLWGAR